MMNMSKHLCILSFLFLLAQQVTAQGWTPSFEKFTLKNGLDVILHRDTTLPIISISMAYRAGSSADPPGKTGLAQIAGEHLLFGTAKVPREKLLEFRNDNNAVIQAQTGVDWVNLSTTVAMNLLEAAIMIEADRLEHLDAVVTNESVASVIKRLRDEHASRSNKPLGTLNQQIYRELYGDRHPYRHSTIGDLAHLDSIQANDVKTFVRRNYVPANASLTLSGNFKPSAARDLVEKYFAKIAPGRGKQWTRIEEVFTPIGLGGFILEDNIRVNQVMMIFPTVLAGNTDEAPLRLLAQVLSGSKEAVLNRNLPKKFPSILSIESSQSSQELAGSFWITVTCKMETPLQPVYDEVMRIIAAIAESGVPEDDLLSAKNHASMAFYTPLENFYGFGGRGDLLNLGNLLSGSPLFSVTQFNATLATGSPSIQRVAATYLTKNNQLVVSVLPAGKTPQAVSFD